jgi:hypothetical protein
MRHVESPFRNERFGHRQHLRFAWTVLDEHGIEEAERIITQEIRAFAELNAPGRYHDTLTRFWVRLVAHTRAHGDNDDAFDRHVERFPILLDTRAPWKHFSDGVLGSATARTGVVAPDLRPIP